MPRTDANLSALLHAARSLITAREDQMVTDAEWDELERSLAACEAPDEPSAIVETFFVDETGHLVRSVIPRRGKPYEHRCSLDAFKSIAHAAAEASEPFTLEDLRSAADLPWTQIAVAFAFLKERGVIVPVTGRKHRPASEAGYEDAMIEYHALRESETAE